MNPCLAILLFVALLPASTDKERRLRLEYDDVAATADALLQTVDAMQADLQRRGMVLHPEIVSARNHLAVAIDRASDALEKQDWRQLRKGLENARGWIARLRRQL